MLFYIFHVCISESLYYCIFLLLYLCITVSLYYCIFVLLYLCITVSFYYCIFVFLEGWINECLIWAWMDKYVCSCMHSIIYGLVQLWWIYMHAFDNTWTCAVMDGYTCIRSGIFLPMRLCAVRHGWINM